MKNICNIFKRKAFSFLLSFLYSSRRSHLFFSSLHYYSLRFQHLFFCFNLEILLSLTKHFLQYHFHSINRFWSDQQKIDLINLLLMNRMIRKLQFFISSLMFSHWQISSRRLIQIDIISMFSRLRFFRLQMFSDVVSDHSKTSKKSMWNFHSWSFRNLLFHWLITFSNLEIVFEKLSILFLKLFLNLEIVLKRSLTLIIKSSSIHFSIINQRKLSFLIPSHRNFQKDNHIFHTLFDLTSEAFDDQHLNYFDSNSRLFSRSKRERLSFNSLNKQHCFIEIECTRSRMTDRLQYHDLHLRQTFIKFWSKIFKVRCF